MRTCFRAGQEKSPYFTVTCKKHLDFNSVKSHDMTHDMYMTQGRNKQANMVLNTCFLVVMFYVDSK